MSCFSCPQCGYMIRPLPEADCFVCRCGFFISELEWKRLVNPKSASWIPTVPHPLLQIDEELKAYGAADE